MGKPKVMVAIRDASSVEGLVTLACQVSQSMNADIKALHVVVVPAATPLDAEDEALDREGKELLAHAKRVAEKSCGSFSTELLRARGVGEALVGEARDQGVELLVMGHHKPHPHSLGESFLGSTVRYVAHHAPCRVIVQIPALEHP